MLRFELIYYAFKISGRVRYKFASFWNRNNALRGLQKAVKNYHAIVEAEKKVNFVSRFRVYQIISKRVKCNELNELLRIKIIQTNPKYCSFLLLVCRRRSNQHCVPIAAPLEVENF